MSPIRPLSVVTNRVTTMSTLLVGVLPALLACHGERGRTNAGTPPTPPSVAVDTTEGADTLVHWDSAAGPALVLSMDSVPDTISVVRPEYTEGRYDDTTMIDLRALSHLRFDLFGRSGTFGSATLTTSALRWHASSDDNDDCNAWPTATMSQSRVGWRVALQSGNATAVPLDSIEGMSPSDSALFVAQVIRMAKELPPDPDADFRSLPFTVRNAYRFQTAVLDVIIAAVQRNIPSEANPREEDVFFVAERPVGSSDDYHLAFFTREAGNEGDEMVANVLAVVMVTKNRRVAVVVSEEDEDGGRIAWVERVAPREWRMVWRSAYVGC